MADASDPPTKGSRALFAIIIVVVSLLSASVRLFLSTEKPTINLSHFVNWGTFSGSINENVENISFHVGRLTPRRLHAAHLRNTSGRRWNSSTNGTDTAAKHAARRRHLIEFDWNKIKGKRTGAATTAADGGGANDPISMIKCNNQTKCIQPELQLKKSFKVYYCKHVSHGVRFYYLAREGLLLHPNIDMVTSPDQADVIVYLPESAAWHKSECAKKEYISKMVVLDEGDGASLFMPESSFLIYFKRSYVRRSRGIFKGYMGYLSRPDVFPMTYMIANSYVRPNFNFQPNRDIDLLCTLRGSKRDPVRARVREAVEEYANARNVKNFLAKQVNSASRTVISTGYFEKMYRSRIIVTSNPSGWEGDFRLCEAIASGALIFVDQMYVPRPKPLEHEKHFVVYDNNNKTDLFVKLDLYRADQQLARRVAINGYIHAMRYHRAANLMDYVFRTLHVKQEATRSGKLELLSNPNWKQNVGTPGQSNNMTAAALSSLLLGYEETGYEMRWKAMEMDHQYRKAMRKGKGK